MAYKPTKKQIEIMKHALGLAWGETDYRNHFCAAEGHADWEELLKLESECLMRRIHHPRELEKQATFMVTNDGKEFCKGIRR